MPELYSPDESPKAYGPAPVGAVEVRPGVVAPISSLSKLDAESAKWSKIASDSYSSYQSLTRQYESLQKPVVGMPQDIWKTLKVQKGAKSPYGNRYPVFQGVQQDAAGAYVINGNRYSLVVTGTPGAPLPETQTSKQLVTQMKVQMSAITNEMNKAVYYSNVMDRVPYVLAGFPDITPEKLIKQMVAPSSLTQPDLDYIKGIIAEEISTLQGLPEMSKDADKTVLDKLVAPLPTPKPVGLTAMTVQLIKGALTAPRVPDQVMSDAEWKEHLEASDAIDPNMKSQAEQIIKEWNDINAQLEANKQGVDNLPTYKFWDYVKEAVVTPGLALGEAFGFYAEHVSQPLAGMLWKSLIPDIEKSYQEYRKAGNTHREALVQAWQGWEAPGASNWAPDWILKYMLMEGMVDPLTYVGWGIATKVTKPLGGFGRMVGAAESGLTQVFDLPFDAVKGFWAKLPKTIPQKSALARSRTGQYFRKAFEVDMKFQADKTGSAFKSLRYANNKDMADFIDRAIKYARGTGAHSEDALGYAGRDLLMHKSFTRDQIESLSKSLKTSFDTISDKDILNINEIFEDFFTSKIGTVDIAADRVVKSLGSTSKDAVKDATTWLTKQADSIINDARKIATYKNPAEGMIKLMERNYDITSTIERSVAYTQRQKMGRVAMLFDDVQIATSRVWSNYIDRFVTKPFSDAYLTFGLKGPFDTLEDNIRSVLGGVTPGRKSAQVFELKWQRVGYDPDMVLRKGISETGGLAKELGGDVTKSGWVLTMANLPVSGPVSGIAKLFGKNITPEQFASGERYLVQEYWNRINSDIRRNFVDAKATQILISKDSESIRMLIKVVDRFNGTANKRLNKEVTDIVQALVLSADPNTVRQAKDMFTHLKIQEKQVRQLVEKYVELPPEIRNSLIGKVKSGELFSVTPAERVVKELVEKVDGIDVSSYGVAGKIVKQERLNVAESQFYNNNVKLVEDTLLDLQRIQKFPVANSIDSAFDVERNALRTTILKDPDVMATRIDELSKMYKEAGITTPQEMAQAMTSLHMVSNTYDMVPKDVIGRASRYSRGLKFDERNPWINKALDDVGKFREKAGSSIDNFVNTIRENLNKPDNTPEYISSANQLLDLRTAKRVKLTDLNTDFNAWRHDYFIGATKDQLKSSSWWDNFYSELDTWTSRIDAEAINYDTLIDASVKQVNIASGFTPTPRPNIIIKGRPLAPADVSKLLEAQGDDLSRAILDMMTIQHDRNRFVAYVMAQVKSGDVGFSPDSVGSVYDQLVSGLVGNQKVVDMLTVREMELEALRKEVHNYYNSRSIKPEDITNINKYVEDTATKLDDTIYEKVKQPTAIERAEEFLRNQEIKVKQGYTRLYRGETRTGDIKQVPDWVKETPEYKSTEESTGRWFSATKEEAQYYVDKFGAGKITYVDVPTPDLPKYIASNLPAGKFSAKGMASKEFFVSPEIASRASDVVKPFAELKPSAIRNKKSAFNNYDQLRQDSMDEATKWYHKEYTDYTNSNMIDDFMKHIYPFWTYESNRWFYLPRAMVRHPVVFTTLGKYNNESDSGYVHIPGTNIDVNPFRGTVFGTLTGSLTRRDYKSYYDSLPIGPIVEYNDFLSRYGFYPGAPWNLILSAIGGVESQMGEAVPATGKSILDIGVALFPDNKAMNFISQKLFNDRFREYLTLKEVVRRGGDGSLIGRKIRGKEKLTDEEQQLWTDSRSQVSWYSAGFEQFGLFRLKSEEQIQIQSACAQAIFEMTGYTPDQQEWMQDHNIRIWDQVGGMSPEQQATLQALGYWKYSGLTATLMPGNEQAIADSITQDWDNVTNYNQTIILQGQLDLQKEFLAGTVGPSDYNARLKELYSQKKLYIDNKVAENPLMLLENRKDYYKQTGVAQPVMHPLKELLALYFSIELKETTNPDTGEKQDDWDTFYSERDAIDSAIPEEYRDEWDSVIAKNQTRVEGVRRTVYDQYFSKYNGIWDSILKRYDLPTQRLINEYLSLERLGKNLPRQALIQDMTDASGRKLVSGFRSDVSSAKEALRYANPSLDAWLFFWGKTSSFQTPESEMAYYRIALQMGRTP